MTVNFEVTEGDAKLLHDITRRYCAFYPKADWQEASMDFTACHANGCPLDLVALYSSNNFNFLHDACGIRDHIDRTTGRLTGHFLPRFALEN